MNEYVNFLLAVLVTITVAVALTLGIDILIDAWRSIFKRK